MHALAVSLKKGDMGIKKKALRETYRMLIEAVYAKWNSEKFDDVPRLMEKYKDQEAEIYDRIVRKYVFCRPRKDWQPLIEAMYTRFNPSKLQELDGIFAKYKDSEAALYRALCDKYLPTLAKDDEPLLFKVWDADGSDAISIKDTEEVVRLVSPSQENDLNPDQILPTDDLDIRAIRASQPGVGEEVPNEESKDCRKDGKVLPSLFSRQLDRESMADAAADADHSQNAQGRSRKKSGRCKPVGLNDASLRPKAAPKPPETSKQLDSAGMAQVSETSAAMQPLARTKRQKRPKENGHAEEPTQGLPGRRKKRRKALGNTAHPEGEHIFQASRASSQELLRESNLEYRRQQLKDKLLELKTQISIQAPNSTHFTVQKSGQNVGHAAGAGGIDDAASSYSYSDDEGRLSVAKTEAERAENRTVVLRNKLEAQLRQKLVKSLTKP